MAPNEMTLADEPLYWPTSMYLSFSAISLATVLVESYSSLNTYFSASDAGKPFFCNCWRR